MCQPRSDLQPSSEGSGWFSHLVCKVLLGGKKESKVVVRQEIPPGTGFIIPVVTVVALPVLPGTKGHRIFGAVHQGWSWSLTAPSSVEQAEASNVLGVPQDSFELKIFATFSRLGLVLQSVQPRGQL